ncbi:hypothetical protein L9F63_026062, partial [Diploptera punctata]
IDLGLADRTDNVSIKRTNYLKPEKWLPSSNIILAALVHNISKSIFVWRAFRQSYINMTNNYCTKAHQYSPSPRSPRARNRLELFLTIVYSNLLRLA